MMLPSAGSSRSLDTPGGIKDDVATTPASRTTSHHSPLHQILGILLCTLGTQCAASRRGQSPAGDPVPFPNLATSPAPPQVVILSVHSLPPSRVQVMLPPRCAYGEAALDSLVHFLSANMDFLFL